MRRGRRKIKASFWSGVANMGVILMVVLCLIVVLYLIITVIRLVF